MITAYQGRVPRIASSAFVAPSADLIGDVEIAENASVWFQCVLRGGKWVTVGHRAILHGCTVEDHCLVGMGAILLNNVRVGAGSIIAAGALVPENSVIPPRSLYMGIPAQFKRHLGDGEQRFIDGHATHYLSYKEIYLSEQAGKAQS